MTQKSYFWDTHPPYVALYNISLTHTQCYITNWNDTPPTRKMTEQEIGMQNDHNHYRGSCKYGRWAAAAHLPYLHEPR